MMPNDQWLSEDDNEPYTLDARRRAALEEVNNARFSWFHVKVAAVAGAGLLTDAYDIFAISLASVMIGYIYGADNNQDFPMYKALSGSQELSLKIATPIGVFFGHLFFGWFADVVGRKKMYGFELLIIIIATLVQALSAAATAIDIIKVLVLWRFVMGLGIGGDYPLSATITSEFSPTHVRGRLMTAVFACQGWGKLLASIVGIALTTGFKHRLVVNDVSVCDYMWRLLVGLGCVPAAIALYFRLTIPETPRFTMDIDRNVHQAAQDIETFLTTGTYYADPDAAVMRVVAPRASRRDFMAYFSQWRNFKVLFGTAWSWFALDIAYYGLGINSEIFTSPFNGWTRKLGVCHTGLDQQRNVYDSLCSRSVGNIIIALGGLIPGYWVTFVLIDRWGRKPIQLMGFGVLTVIFVIMSGAYHQLVQTEAASTGFVVLFCFANFFANFGPNTTTFIIPGEAFPTRYRSTAHGISAASGKFGAILTQVIIFGLPKGDNNNWIRILLGIFAAFMATGLLSTLLIPETKGRTLEDMSNEDQKGFVQGPLTIPNYPPPEHSPVIAAGPYQHYPMNPLS